MTIIRRDDDGSAFGQWLREQEALDSAEFCLSITDCDFWVHRYTPRQEKNSDVRQVIDHLMLVEVKCFNRSVPFAQSDTLQLVDQLCRRATTNARGKRRTAKLRDLRDGRVGPRRVRFLGVHVLQMSGDRPDNSDEIRWDAKYDLTEGALIRLLRFDSDPDSPTRPLDTRRHHRRPTRETHPLFGILAGGAVA